MRQFFLYSEICDSKYIRLALKDLNENQYFIGTAGGYNWAKITKPHGNENKTISIY